VARPLGTQKPLCLTAEILEAGITRKCWHDALLTARGPRARRLAGDRHNRYSNRNEADCVRPADPEASSHATSKNSPSGLPRGIIRLDSGSQRPHARRQSVTAMNVELLRRLRPPIDDHSP